MDELMNTAPCGFLTFTDAGQVMEVNDTLAKLLHYTAEEIKGKNIETLFTIANRIFYQTHFFPLIKLHNKAEEIFLTLKGNDVEVPVLVSAVRKEEHGSFINHCIFVPVYQRQKYEEEILNAKKKAEEALHKNEILVKVTEELETHKTTLDRKVTRLLQINEELVQLSGIISHDLQEPIRKISMFADKIMLDHGDILSGPANDNLKKIKENCFRMRRLAFSLDQFVTAGMEFSPVSIDLSVVIKQAKINAETKQEASLEVDHDELPAIEGNPAQLSVLFFNLFDNALKFRSNDQPAAVTVKHSIIEENTFKNTKEKYNYTEHLRLEICDNGIGFNNSYNDYVFKMFKRIDLATAGIGFGLSLCKKIVENHGGTISCSSQPGVGTCFVVILPVEQ